MLAGGPSRMRGYPGNRGRPHYTTWDAFALSWERELVGQTDLLDGPLTRKKWKKGRSCNNHESV
jgi:hypothetical protein